MTRPRAVIVDYGMGNLFSARQAAERAGLDAVISAAREEVLAADAVVLPGMGAFGDAMAALRELALVEALQSVAVSGRPIMGVCLGMQLLMTRSFEFGEHEGLGLVPGEVRRLSQPLGMDGRRLKVPHVGWNRIHRPLSHGAVSGSSNRWIGTPLEELSDGEYMYFVHSYHVTPADSHHVLSVSRFGDVEFCSTLIEDNIFGTQFHPERSGPEGLKIYENFARRIGSTLRRDGVA